MKYPTKKKNCQSTRKHSPSQRIVMLRMPVPRKSGTWEARSPWLWPQTSMQLADVASAAYEPPQGIAVELDAIPPAQSGRISKMWRIWKRAGKSQTGNAVWSASLIIFKILEARNSPLEPPSVGQESMTDRRAAPLSHPSRRSQVLLSDVAFVFDDWVTSRSRSRIPPQSLWVL